VCFLVVATHLIAVRGRRGSDGWTAQLHDHSLSFFNTCRVISFIKLTIFCRVSDVMHALEAGAVETLIVYEDLDIVRYVLRTTTGDKQGEEKVLYLSREQEKDQEQFKETELVSKEMLVDWLADNYKKFGANLQFVTNKSQQGAQFVKGFGGIGAILRWKMDFSLLDQEENADEDYDLEF
jgi:hypothetical protein